MNSFFLYFSMIGVVVFGSANTLISKAMDRISANGEDFNHPYFQTAGMFLGESFCMLAYMLYTKFSSYSSKNSEISNKNSEVYEKLGKFVFLFPAFFDLVASTLMFIGLVLSGASVYQMMRGFIIPVVAISSVIFLERKIFRHQILGASLSTVGVCIVGMTSILFQSSSAPNPVLGTILILIGQVFIGGIFITEELFFSKIVVDPLEAVGVEGICGFCYYLILLPVLYAIPCSQDFCVNGRVEDVILAFEQISSNCFLAILVVLSMVSVSLFNWTGVSTTKYSGSLTRSTLDTSRIFLVWLASMLIGWESFLWPQLIGFFFLASGTLIYNEVIVLPFLGFEQSILDNKADKETRDKERLSLIKK